MMRMQSPENEVIKSWHLQIDTSKAAHPQSLLSASNLPPEQSIGVRILK